MKIIASPFNPRLGSAISRVFNAVFFSGEARSDSLLLRISDAGDPKFTMVALLDQWLEEGQKVNQSELHGIIKLLRKFRRYRHALQVHKWMTEKTEYENDSASTAIRLDLISKVRGLDEAVNFFNSIPSSTKDDKIYGSMLSCYAAKRSRTKAEELFEKMKELGFVKQALTYNVMLNLYARIGDHEKLDRLVEEMKEISVTGDSYTSNIVLNAYANTNNVEKMEKLFMEMEDDSQVRVDLCSYFTVIKGYLKANFPKKALTALTKAEEVTKITGGRRHYELLIIQYAALKKKDDVYRVWDAYKNTGRVSNSGYISMLSSLQKLGDVDGAEKIAEEWESGNTGFNPRMANLVILAHCNNGNPQKAFALSEKITSQGKKLDGIVWQCLAMHYCAEGNMSKAVETIRKALSAYNGPSWRLDNSVLASCLDYLKSEGDKVKASELLGLVRKCEYLPSGVCNRLLDFMSGDTDSEALALMEDNVSVDVQLTDEM